MGSTTFRRLREDLTDQVEAKRQGFGSKAVFASNVFRIEKASRNYGM